MAKKSSHDRPEDRLLTPEEAFRAKLASLNWSALNIGYGSVEIFLNRGKPCKITTRQGIKLDDIDNSADADRAEQP